MNWTKEQKQVIDFRNGNLLVSAAAGSGKTAVLVERIIQMVFDRDNPIDVDDLLVVTFTKAAASQMKDKISLAIEKRIGEEPGNERYIRQLNLVRDANILTIDSFCYKVLKEYFHVIALDPKIQVAEETDLCLIKEDVISEVMDEFYRDNDDFSNFSDAYSSDKSDANIEEYILKLYELSESYPFPHEWFENARKSLHVVSEEDLLTLPFYNSYIDEIHSIAGDIRNTIIYFLDMTRQADGPAHYEKTLISDIELIDDIISANSYGIFADIRDRKFAALGRAKKSDVFDGDVAELIKKGRDRYKKKIGNLLQAFSVPVDRIIGQLNEQERLLLAFIDASEEFSKRFLERKISKGFVGFSDVEHFALQILCDGTDEEGKPVPSNIGKELSEKYYEILIDEYQDSNYLQEYILQCVSGVPHGDNNIFMVGDVKQSIYGFRMARPDLFTSKYDTYNDIDNENNDNVKILLNNNFRSRRNILESINYIFYQIMDRSLGGIDYTDKEALAAGREYTEYENDEVELLLGESKDADMLLPDGEDNKDEHLDDEYIDVSGMELEAGMVAGRIRELMGDNGSERHMITDDSTGALRPVNYRDIVILFRAPKSYQAVFSEILMKHGIPVKLQNENGYFDLVEIRTVLTILKVIDNPYDDVECAAFLRGFFCGLDSNELAVISMMKKSVEKRESTVEYLFMFLESVVNNREYFDDILRQVFYDKSDEKELELIIKKSGIIPESVFEKCSKAVSVIKEFQESRKYVSITELIRKIYYETGYYYYVEAMPQGRERSRNLVLFADEATRYEQRGNRSLFDFLRFIKRLSERGVSLGGEASGEITEDMVRIMSIHRSKGLEFPVVFVSGIGKRFNLADTKLPIILHSDYYIGAKYIDPHKRIGNDTFIRKAFGSLITSENIAEELRIFYVALTRAKEKLILTGVTPDITKLIDKMRRVAMFADNRISYSVLRDAESYLDLVTAAFMRNRGFHEIMKAVKPRYDKKGNIVSADYDVKKYIDEPASRIIFKLFYYNNLLVSQIESGAEQMLIRSQKLESFLTAQSDNFDALKTNLSWSYPEDELTRQKSKMSVTEIKRTYQIEQDEITDDLVSDSMIKEEKYKEILPGFIAGEKPIDAAGKGTWFHKVMELLNNEKLDSSDSVVAELDRLYEEGRIPSETRSFITYDKIISFAKSDIGQRMMNAARENRLYKERKFVVGFPVKDNAPDVIVQGIIDAYFEEEGKLILLDYKTDNIEPGQETILVDRYRSQLDYYKKTLEKITGMEVAEIYLYSFALDKGIKM